MINKFCGYCVQRDYQGLKTVQVHTSIPRFIVHSLPHASQILRFVQVECQPYTGRNILTYSRLSRQLAFLAIKYIWIKGVCGCLDIVLLHICYCRIVETNFICTGKPKNSCSSLNCDIYLIVVSGSKSTRSPRYTYIWVSLESKSWKF